MNMGMLEIAPIVRDPFQPSKLILERTKRTDPRLLELMKVHYSAPNGFVGRVLAYAIYYDGVYYGHTIGGSTPKHLPRGKFWPNCDPMLNHIVNNIFYHLTGPPYPVRNFATRVVSAWRNRAAVDWLVKYGDVVAAFETLVELPRTGECYLRDGWQVTGTTKGYTCKRVAGGGSDSWSGRRVWDTKNLRPKLVLIRQV